MRSTILWILFLFVGIFHILTLAYSPLPNLAEYGYAQEVYAKSGGLINQATPLYSILLKGFTASYDPSIFRFRLLALLAGLACLPVAYFLARRTGVKKFYAELLLFLLCFEPEFTIALHNGQPGTLALLFVLLSLLTFYFDETSKLYQWGLAGLFMGLSWLVFMPLMWFSLAFLVWQIGLLLTKPNTKTGIGILIFMLSSGLPLFIFSVVFSMSYQTLTAGLLNQNIWAWTTYFQTSSIKSIHLWQYALLLTILITTILYIRKEGWRLPHAQIACLSLIVFFVIVNKHTQDGISLLIPLIYYVLVYITNKIGIKTYWDYGRMILLLIVVNNTAFSIAGFLMILLSIGGRDFAMADYEIAAAIKPGQKVVGDPTFAFSVWKAKGEFIPIQQFSALKYHPDYLILKTLEQKQTESIKSRYINIIDTIPVAKLRSYVNTPYLSRDAYGWFAIKNKDWEANYDGAIYKLR